MLYNRYQIKVNVRGGKDEKDSSTVTFVIFNRDVAAVLNKTCSEMIDSVEKVFAVLNNQNKLVFVYWWYLSVYLDSMFLDAGFSSLTPVYGNITACGQNLSVQVGGEECGYY